MAAEYFNVNHMGLRPHVALWQTTRFQLDVSQPLVMGILNVTPDSFSDASSHHSLDATISRAKKMVDEGADIVDVGGESSRPGAQALTAEEEWSRVGPVIQELVKWDIPLSIDTYHPESMKRALDIGVDIVNDIWALRQDGALQAVAPSSCGICLMHMQGEPSTMQLNPLSQGVMVVLNEFFTSQLSRTDAMGIHRSRVVIDPGIGFGKTVSQNFEILQRQSNLLALGATLMVGWSNKSSLGLVSGLPVERRLVPSISAAILAVERGARVLRVHAVAETVAALSVWKAGR